METHRKQEATRKSRRMEEDKEGFMKTQRKDQANRKARRMKEDKEGFNEKHREEVAKYRGNAENTYLNEVRLAAIFPCVCCHTLNFRQQVVEFSQKQADSIQEKALAVYQKQKVKFNISRTDFMRYLKYHKHFMICLISHENIS